MVYLNLDVNNLDINSHNINKETLNQKKRPLKLKIRNKTLQKATNKSKQKRLTDYRRKKKQSTTIITNKQTLMFFFEFLNSLKKKQ